jgi:hypothetical protein
MMDKNSEMQGWRTGHTARNVEAVHEARLRIAHDVMLRILLTQLAVFLRFVCCRIGQKRGEEAQLYAKKIPR